MVRNLVRYSPIEFITLQAEQASVAYAAQASARNWTQSLESHTDLHDYVLEGWSLVRTTPHDCLGSTQTVMGFKLGECTDLYTSDMWVSYMQICDRTGQGFAQYGSSVSTATYLGRGCTGPALGTSIVAWGGSTAYGGVGHSICSDGAFVDVMKHHQAGIMSAVYSDQFCAGAPSKFQLLTLGGCAKAPDSPFLYRFDDDDHQLTFLSDDHPYIQDGYIRLSSCDSLSISYEVFSDAKCTSSQFKSTFPMAEFGPSSCQAMGLGSYQVECW